jgi:hypothetical protein
MIPRDRLLQELAKRDPRYAQYVGKDSPSIRIPRVRRPSPPPPPPGVGTELTQLITELAGAASNSACGCKALAVEMDKKGADWCWDARYNICDRLRENIKKASMKTKALAIARAASKLMWLDPTDIAPGLFDRAYDRYCEKHPEYRSRR